MRDGNLRTTLKSGISFGSALAMVISYVNWHSVGWAVCSWPDGVAVCGLLHHQILKL